MRGDQTTASKPVAYKRNLANGGGDLYYTDSDSCFFARIVPLSSKLACVSLHSPLTLTNHFGFDLSSAERLRLAALCSSNSLRNEGVAEQSGAPPLTSLLN
jgi:hypothetical protein